jgi:RHS repeat-associated protein
VAQGGVPIPVEDYAYDGEGNRTASHLSLAHLANDHNQFLEDDSYTYAYDSKGNRVSRTAKVGGVVETYAYNSQNRLVGYANPTTTATYAYDALDRRVAKTVDGVTEAWVYDSADLSDSTASNTALTFRAGALIKRWLFGPQVDEPLAYENYTGTTASGSGSVIELLANRLGSIITAISVSTGAVAAEYDYDSFGTRTETATLDQPYGFTGREHDAESGLMHYRARAYDPETGLFLQRDPLGFSAGDLNLYRYVWNDPHNWKDPSGLDCPH